MKNVRYALAFACLVPAAMLWGCSTSNGNEAEQVGKGVAAFDEASCGTETPDTTDSTSVTACGQQAGGTSGTTYGTSTCKDGFKVQLSGNVSSSAVAVAQLIASLSQSDCANASVFVNTYNSSGTLVNSAVSNSSTCSWVSDDGGTGFNFCLCYASAAMPGGTGTRVVAMAGLNDSYTTSPKVYTEGTLEKVTVTVRIPGC